MQDRPARGWIRAIRDALGMSARQLGTRMGVSRAAVAQAERREIDDAITLGALRRAAEALGCTLEYVLLPTGSLQGAVETRARQVASSDLTVVSSAMAIEQQAVGASARGRVFEDHVRRVIDARRLWDDT